MIFSKKTRALNYKKGCVEFLELYKKRYEIICNISLLTFIENVLNDYYSFEELKDKKSLYYFLLDFEKKGFLLDSSFIIYLVRKTLVDFIGEDEQEVEKNLNKAIEKYGIGYFNDFMLKILLNLQIGGDALKKKDLLKKMIIKRVLMKNLKDMM